MIVHAFKSVFPTKRHNDMLINHCGTRNYSAFFVPALVKWFCYRFDFLFNDLFKLRTSVVAFNPRKLGSVPVNHCRNGYGRNVRVFLCHFHIGN